jgi:hypothetical protein
MKRMLGLITALALCAGCRSSQPVYDPFLGPTTVPPPGTATPTTAAPYYGPAGAPVYAPPATTTAPGVAPPPGATAPVVPRGAVPMNFAPAPAGGMSSFTPNVSPLQPTPAPRLQPTPAMPGSSSPVAGMPASSAVRPVYGPPGGSSFPGYPQAALPQAVNPQLAPQYGTPTLAPPNPAAQPNGSGVMPATHWEAAGKSSPAASQNPASTGATQLSPSSAQQLVPPNQIRIVQPASASAPTTSSTSNSAAPGLFQPNGAVSPAPIGSGAAPTGSWQQPVIRAQSSGHIPDITELPPAGTAYVMQTSPQPATTVASTVAARSTIGPTTGVSPTSAPMTASSSTPPSSVQLASYGYDTQYRWLKGQLEYSQSTHTWRLRYIPPDGATDNYGGSVVLPDASKLNGLKPGDLVVVQGSPGAASGDQNSFAPLYNLTQIQKQ